MSNTKNLMSNTKKLNILFLTPRFPYPLIGGDRLKAYHTISYLAKSHNVTVISFYQGDSIPHEYVKAIEDLGAKIRVIKLSPIRAALSSLVRNNPLNPLEINYYTQPQFREAVLEEISNSKIDLAISFFMRTAEYIKNNTNIKKVLMAEDCRVLYQQRSYQESKNLLQKAIRLFEYQTLKKYEPNILKHFDITTLVTQNDINAIKSHSPNAVLRLLSNGTDTDLFCPPSPNSKRSGILFSGKLDVWANVLMVQKIVTEIMPLIWNRLPNAKLTIAGANPSNEIMQYQSERINILPNVPSMVSILQSASVFLHPHAGGTGIQNKLLEAMACGTPVVTTPIGNQGIEANNQYEVLLGNTPQELANLTVSLLNNSELANSISHNCRQLIIKKHSWQSVLSNLDNILDELL